MPSGGSYVPVTPVRVVDTRINQGIAGPVRGQQHVPVAVGTDLVPAGAAAVALSVTAVDGSGDGFLSVYPDGLTPPGDSGIVSNLNFKAGTATCAVPDCVTSNLVISPISSAGRFEVFDGQAATDTVDVVVDVEGYFNSASVTSGAQGHYYPLSPARLGDTRCGEQPPNFNATCAMENIPSANAGLTTMSAGSSINVNVAGNGGVPPAGAEAAVVQLIATNTSANGYLSATPTGSMPNVGSNVNFVAGQTASTAAIVKVGSGGAITVYNSGGSTDVVVDVVGFISDTTTAVDGGSLYVPVVPTRLSDSRSGNGGLGALGPNANRLERMAGTAPIPAGATSAVINLTEAATTDSGYLSVTPTPLSPPASTSDVNFTPGEIRANADLATLSSSDGSISVYNSGGSTDFVVDVFGYFVQATNVPTGSPGGGGPSPYAGLVGVNSLYSYFSEQTGQAGLTTLAGGGVGWDRENFSWGNLEPQPGTWDWTEADNLMTAASKSGTNIHILGLLGHDAPWASSDPNPGDNCRSANAAGACWNYPPADPRLFATYAATVAARYGPGGAFWTANPQLRPDPLAAIEVWNEPWGYWSWQPNPDPAAYATLFIDAANAIHRAAAMPVLMAGDLNEVSTVQGQVRPWLSPLLAAIEAAGYNPAALARGLSVHPYPDPMNLSPADRSGNPTYGYSRVSLVHQAEMAAGYDIPLWITEIGWFTCDSSFACTQSVSPATQASYLSQAIQIAHTSWSPYVAHIFVYGFNSGNFTPDNYDIAGTPAWTCITTLISSGSNRC